MSTDELLAALDKMVLEVEDLRSGTALLATHSSPQFVLEALLDCRQRLDRVEELFRRCLRIRGHLRRVAAISAASCADAWDKAAADSRTAGARDEYSSAKERAAVANLAVLDLRRTERLDSGALSRAEEVVEVVRVAHRGLADFRQDLLAVLRAQQFESTLDR